MMPSLCTLASSPQATEARYLDAVALEPPPDFPESAIIELRATPRISTWQQEFWLVHCKDFMAYIGTWEPKDFSRNSTEGDGRALFLEMTDDLNHLWDSSLPPGANRLESWYATYYAFRC
jgi:uncharacterized protein CbrC (UPF0167 family)